MYSFFFLFLVFNMNLFVLTYCDIESELLRTDKVYSILDQHNQYRKNHGVPELELDEVITDRAQQWAEHSSNIGALVRNPMFPFGQNIWKKSNTSLESLMQTDETNPVKIWYDEIKFYPGYYDPFPRDYWRSFTQIIWKDSKKLGVGIAGEHNVIYVACFYHPPGNVITDNEYDTDLIYRRNVLSLGGKTWTTSTELFYILIIALLTLVVFTSCILCFRK